MTAQELQELAGAFAPEADALASALEQSDDLPALGELGDEVIATGLDLPDQAIEVPEQEVSSEMDRPHSGQRQPEQSTLLEMPDTSGLADLAGSMEEPAAVLELPEPAALDEPTTTGADTPERRPHAEQHQSGGGAPPKTDEPTALPELPNSAALDESVAEGAELTERWAPDEDYPLPPARAQTQAPPEPAAPQFSQWSEQDGSIVFEDEPPPSATPDTAGETSALPQWDSAAATESSPDEEGEFAIGQRDR